MALINPPAALLECVNAIAEGRARRYAVADFTGPLSIKAVISGTAAWETRDSRFPLGPSGCLLLHDGKEGSNRGRRSAPGRDVSEPQQAVDRHRESADRMFVPFHVVPVIAAR